jgi:hypothetical protein
MIIIGKNGRVDSGKLFADTVAIMESALEKPPVGPVPSLSMPLPVWAEPLTGAIPAGQGQQYNIPRFD